MRRRVQVLAALAVLAAAPASAETLRFTGTTTADATMIKDTLKQVQLIGLGKFNCGVIGSVEAEVLPAAYRPEMDHQITQSANEVHERWIVSLCGRREPFLVGFWPAPQGGTMFHVAHPFPVDVGAKARR